MSTLEGQPPAYAPGSGSDSGSGYPGHAPHQHQQQPAQPQPAQPGQPIYVQPQHPQQQYVPQAQAQPAPYQGEGQPMMYAHAHAQPTVASPPGYIQGMPVQPQPGAYAQPYVADPAFGQQAYGGQQMMYVAQPMGGVYAQPVQVMGSPASPTATVVVIGGAQGGTPYYLGFSDGIFDCFDECLTCLLAYFVTPIRWAMTTDRAGLLSFIVALVLYGIPFWATYVFVFVTGARVPYVQWPLIAAWIVMIALGTIYRTQLRNKYGLIGSGFEDCCLHTWCTCCAVSQEARHVDRMTGRLPHSAYVQYR